MSKQEQQRMDFFTGFLVVVAMLIAVYLAVAA